jgi:hypothetical protein
MLLMAIKSSRLCSLKSLAVLGMGRGNPFLPHFSPWLTFDYSRLKQAMLDHIPDLRRFKWEGMLYDHYREGLLPFVAFTSFPQLKELSLDFNLFVNGAGGATAEEVWSGLAIPQDYFSPDLEYLSVDMHCWRCLSNKYSGYLGFSQYESNAHQHLATMIASFPMEEIRLSLDMKDWPHEHGIRAWKSFALDEPVVHLLKALADELYGQGIRLRVNYYMNQDGARQHPLVRAGMTAERIYYDEFEGIRE